MFRLATIAAALALLAACKGTHSEDVKTICDGPQIAAKGMGGVPPSEVDPVQGLRMTVGALQAKMGKETLAERAPYLTDEKVSPHDKSKKLREQAKAAEVSPCALADWIDKSFK